MGYGLNVQVYIVRLNDSVDCLTRTVWVPSLNDILDWNALQNKNYDLLSGSICLHILSCINNNVNSSIIRFINNETLEKLGNEDVSTLLLLTTVKAKSENSMKHKEHYTCWKSSVSKQMRLYQFTKHIILSQSETHTRYISSKKIILE